MKKCRICGHEALKNHVEQYHKILTEYNKTASYEAKSRGELNKEIKKLADFINVASFENPMNLGPDKERLEGLKNELASLGEAREDEEKEMDMQDLGAMLYAKFGKLSNKEREAKGLWFGDAQGMGESYAKEESIDQTRARMNNNLRAIGMDESLSEEENIKILEDFIKNDNKPMRGKIGGSAFGNQLGSGYGESYAREDEPLISNKNLAKMFKYANNMEDDKDYGDDDDGMSEWNALGASLAKKSKKELDDMGVVMIPDFSKEGRGDTYGRRQENLWPEHTDETQCVTCGQSVSDHSNPNTDYRGNSGTAPPTDHYFQGGDMGGSDDKLYFESKTSEARLGSDDCRNCSGDGKTECSKCHGRGTWYVMGEDKECPNCDGEGDEECEVCGGSGERYNESYKAREGLTDNARQAWDSGETTAQDVSDHYYGDDDGVLNYSGQSFDSLPQNVKDSVLGYTEDLTSRLMSMTTPDSEEWNMMNDSISREGRANEDFGSDYQKAMDRSLGLKSVSSHYSEDTCKVCREIYYSPNEKREHLRKHYGAYFDQIVASEDDPDYEGDQKTIKALLKKNGSVTFEDFLAQDGDYPQDLGESLTSDQKGALDEYVQRHGQEDRDSIYALAGWGSNTHLPADILKRVKGADEDEMLDYIQDKADVFGGESQAKEYDDDDDYESNADYVWQNQWKGGSGWGIDGSMTDYEIKQKWLNFAEKRGVDTTEATAKWNSFEPTKRTESHEYICTECGDKFGERDEYVDHQNTHKEES